jgi:competence ComEA-like helix-hairpin-helix protein
MTMALFGRKDRIAVTIIAALILTGWGIRILHRTGDGGVRIIRGVVKVPATVSSPDSASAGTGTPSAVVDINLAGQAQLERLPMIGPVKAAAIVKYRSDHGPFAKPSDIVNVPGIGPKTFEGIERFITVGGPPAGK